MEEFIDCLLWVPTLETSPTFGSQTGLESSAFVSNLAEHGGWGHSCGGDSGAEVVAALIVPIATTLDILRIGVFLLLAYQRGLQVSFIL